MHLSSGEVEVTNPQWQGCTGYSVCPLVLNILPSWLCPKHSVTGTADWLVTSWVCPVCGNGLEKWFWVVLPCCSLSHCCVLVVHAAFQDHRHLLLPNLRLHQASTDAILMQEGSQYFKTVNLQITMWNKSSSFLSDSSCKVMKRWLAHSFISISHSDPDAMA